MEKLHSEFDNTEFPFHDATINRLEIKWLDEDKKDKILIVDVRIHPDEDLEPFRKYGIEGDLIRVVFSEVLWLEIKADLDDGARDLIDDIDYIAKNGEHSFQIILISGSKIRFRADKIAIMGYSN